MDYSQLQKLNALFAEEIEKERLSDASILVEHQGKIQFTGFYGNAHPNSIFKIYSMTKPITAVAAMMLLERGIIDIEDDVSRYLPGLDVSVMKTFVTEKYDIAQAKNIEKTARGNLVTESKNPIKIKHLLNMTSGLPYPTEYSKVETEVFDAVNKIHSQLADGNKLSNTEIATILAQTPLAFEPGTGWLYGTSADIMGAVIESASGVKFGDFLKTELFDPLGMKDTWFSVKKENLDRLIKPYTRCSDGHVEPVNQETLAWMNQLEPEKEALFQAGGSYLYSTMEDYYRFAKMLLNEGTLDGKRYLGRKTIEFMTTDQLSDSQRKMCWLTEEGYGYANYFRIMKNPEKNGCGSIGEFGWDGMAGTYFLVDPKEQLIVVYMQQIKEGGDKSLRRKFRNIIYGAI